MLNDEDNPPQVALADEGVLSARILTLDGEAVSIRLEASYWRALEDICAREGMNADELVADMRYRMEERAPKRRYGVQTVSVTPVSLANAVRVFVVGYFRRAATEVGHRRAGHGTGELFLRTPMDPVGTSMPLVGSDGDGSAS